jgi:hypothetical protein
MESNSLKFECSFLVKPGKKLGVDQMWRGLIHFFRFITAFLCNLLFDDE